MTRATDAASSAWEGSGRSSQPPPESWAAVSSPLPFSVRWAASNSAVSVSDASSRSTSTRPARTSAATTPAASNTVKPQSMARSATERSPSTLQSIAHSPGPRIDVVVGLAAGRQERDRVRPADLAAEAPPTRTPLADQVQDDGDVGGRCDVLAGLLVLAEAPGVHVPAEEVAEHVDELLGDEGLDELAVDVAQVDEKLAQPPALQLGALDLQRLGEGFGGKGSGRHQSGAQQGPTTRHEDRVDEAFLEVDLGLLGRGVEHGQAAGRLLCAEVEENLLHLVGEEVSVEHAGAPSPRSSAAARPVALLVRVHRQVVSRTLSGELPGRLYPHPGERDTMPPMSSAHTLITVAPTGAETAKADAPALPVTLDELVATAVACEAAGAGLIHVHIRDAARPAHPRPGPAHRDRRRAARGHHPGRPALHRRQRPRPARGPAAGARRRARLLLPHLRHGELRRGRLPEPLAVHGRALPAHPGARGRARVRAVRPRPRARAEPAARPARRARTAARSTATS